MEKRDVRLQVFVTPDMDDRLTDISDIMGMSKNEMVRYAIGTMCASWSAGVKIATEKFDKEMDAETLKKIGKELGR